VVEGVDVYGLKSLPQAVDLVNSPESFQPVRVDAHQLLTEAAQYGVDLRDVHGQQAAKRIPTILPPMSLDEAIETTRIHSVAGVLEDSRGLVGTRPYRSPHHQRCWTDWRRRCAEAGRGFAGAQWRALSG
jgi:magnesium chelatase family protein